jgi:hypothetical protein
MGAALRDESRLLLRACRSPSAPGPFQPKSEVGRKSDSAFRRMLLNKATGLQISIRRKALSLFRPTHREQRRRMGGVKLNPSGSWIRRSASSFLALPLHVSPFTIHATPLIPTLLPPTGEGLFWSFWRGGNVQIGVAVTPSRFIQSASARSGTSVSTDYLLASHRASMNIEQP